MSTLKKLKELIANKSLNKKLRSRRRNVRVHNFDSAESVGIIFNPNENNSFDKIKDFLSYLSDRNIKVFALGYLNSKIVPQEFLMRKGFNFICLKDLTWAGTPKSEVIEEFINQSFDILIDLNLKEFFPIQYITAISNASFKIGMHKHNIQPYDLMINIEGKESISYLIEQITHYLNVIKN